MASGSIRMICPNLRCRKVLSAPPAARGRDVRCPHCGTRIKVPAEARKTDAPAEA